MGPQIGTTGKVKLGAHNPLVNFSSFDFWQRTEISTNNWIRSKQTADLEYLTQKSKQTADNEVTPISWKVCYLLKNINKDINKEVNKRVIYYIPSMIG